ncbi:N-formylglutamate amidohydrolase [Pontixanthobacter aestiaquae]|uniref:N-formylglutamate amidohydrolase n=1 Tax=Pontixanthobacter aestiaquae TaxID=1509367 RepID=A0A844ZA22_9SPHN|nr:N-formylglutamate amidohydrolase [Pontixanthobacter aestiaquae]MDN3645117.1 N-formylglutamate amidohydrolase [Pontixanthobacter aestiaquae]MXO83883.1 N-formylglutamate amidohydrolase [Pontixanthobacter aestiaquae]
MTQDNDNQVDAGLDQGGIIPGTRKPAYSLKLPDDLPIPVLIAVPHAGRVYPDHLVKRMRRPDYSSIRLEDRHVDQLGSLVARQTGAGFLVAHAPRAMLDLNRATDDVDWDMIADSRPDGVRHSLANRRARSGLGLIPRRLPGLGEIWSEMTSQAELDARIRQVHVPYHSALSSALQTMRDQWGAALLLDFHSMPPLRKANHDDLPAQFVLGDRFGASADDRLVASALRTLSDDGGRAAHNRPYAGGYVLDRHAAPARSIHAIQLEICRSLYLEKDMSSLSADTAGLSARLAGLVRVIGEEVAALGRSRGQPLAAE